MQRPTLFSLARLFLRHSQCSYVTRHADADGLQISEICTTTCTLFLHVEGKLKRLRDHRTRTFQHNMSSDQDNSNSDGAVAVASNGSAAAQADGAEGQQQPPAQQRRSGWDMLRTILFQMVIFYFITSFFRGRQTPPPTNPDGSTSLAGANLFPSGLELVGIC